MCTCLGRGEGYKRTLQLGEHRGHVTHSERVRRGMNEAPPAPGFTPARSHRAAVAIAPSTAPSAGSIHGHSEPLNHHRPPILRQRPVHVTQPKVLWVARRQELPHALHVQLRELVLGRVVAF
eukprot:CAMPEP_0181368754 /NCGR_PEP_ID=MMETSP1106-20121128/12314_1 /TAXON_ID=81844 /ORGANISM="Mantoniella antarctica, Strain SL-175" /LENGTH=121 /DNA_ID=CAMNT_0023485007 /DNA_START=435 /DNA_END=800 /DNA_ORIENTATION=+